MSPASRLLVSSASPCPRVPCLGLLRTSFRRPRCGDARAPSHSTCHPASRVPGTGLGALGQVGGRECWARGSRMAAVCSPENYNSEYVKVLP